MPVHAFNALVDCKSVRMRIKEVPFDVVGIDDEFTAIFCPRIKYEGRTTNVPDWFCGFAAGNHGSYEDAAFLEEKYKNHLETNGAVFWDSPRSIAKTCYRFLKNKEKVGTLSHIDFYKLVSLTMKNNEGLGNRYFGPRAITSTKFEMEF